jgi:hypothetical protein
LSARPGVLAAVARLRDLATVSRLRRLATAVTLSPFAPSWPTLIIRSPSLSMVALPYVVRLTRLPVTRLCLPIVRPPALADAVAVGLGLFAARILLTLGLVLTAWSSRKVLILRLGRSSSLAATVQVLRVVIAQVSSPGAIILRLILSRRIFLSAFPRRHSAHLPRRCTLHAALLRTAPHLTARLCRLRLMGGRRVLLRATVSFGLWQVLG